VQITARNLCKKFSGDGRNFTDLEVSGGGFKLEFESDAGDVHWGYRLQVTPKFDDFQVRAVGRTGIGLCRYGCITVVEGSKSPSVPDWRPSTIPPVRGDADDNGPWCLPLSSTARRGWARSWRRAAWT
jgi:hypothetical protein